MKKKRFSEEQIVRLLRSVETGGRPVEEVCREHGVSVQSYYRWKKQYGGMAQGEVKRLRQLEQENARLKRLVAERDLEIDAIKDVLAKKF